MRTRQMANFEEKFEELKEHIQQQFCHINKQFEESCEKFFEKFRNQIKEDFANELNKRDERSKQLESDKAMPQKHILKVKKQNVANQSEIEVLEQYGRRQCLRFEGVTIERNETSDKVLTDVLIDLGCRPKILLVDVDCRPKIKWSDDLVNDIFHSLNELKSILALDV